MTTTFQNLTFTLTDDPSPDQCEAINQRIKAFNNKHSPHHLAVRSTGTQPLNLFLHNTHGELVGGLTAATAWQWLLIHDFWLAPHLRHLGHGRRLLDQAEREAARRHCLRAQLKTFSFQARDFYQKQGYRVVGEMTDYPPGASFYWLRKDWDPATRLAQPEL
ncbi:MAG TPA: GNAT family N-acetyltransferase [Anaerolineae bacterium]|nr:GNAT family N-acetyltransferase [Anaerolineae bacterium]